MQVSKSFTQSVREIMNKDVPKLDEESTLRVAIDIFRKDKIMILPVMDKRNRFIGIMTPSALFNALAENASIDEKILPFMIKQAVTLYENDDLQKVRDYLDSKQVGQAVVLTKDHQVCGVLDTKNIVQAYQNRSENLTNSLEALILDLQTGILAIDPNGKILVVNHAAESMCNQSSQDMVGEHFSSILPEIKFSSQSFISSDIPLHSITANDKKLLLTYKSLSNKSNYWGGIILIQDLTDYEQIASELEITKKLERTLQTVLDTSYDGLIVIDHNGKIEMCNEAACELIRTNKDKVVAQSVTKLFPEIRLEEVLTQDSYGEKLEAMVIGKQRCLVIKIPIYRDNLLVGAIAKIIYKNLTKWKSVVGRLDDLEKEISYYRGELSLIGGTPFDLDDIITRNEEMGVVKQFARQIAPGFSNVLLLGESGTGKELFARGIHAASKRTGNFIKINCAAIPEELWESEFFGYADGAFTGAKRGGKPGKFELANNGTIFLDEIGDMPLSMQVKLLRVLQEREFERVGGTKTIRVNVRIIAATNKDLELMVAMKKFREDLFYRLNVIVINIPPLREHKEDIPLLALSITKKFSHLLGLGQVKISKQALELLSSHNWPGNVRELENVIERAMNCIETDRLEVKHLPEYIQREKVGLKISPPIQVKPSIQEQELFTADIYRSTKNKAEKDAIEAALYQTGGNRTAAAKLLGISRSQFYKKLEKFRLEI
jgi:transcriptional regulator with PAS, ATPase and Fis domain